MKYAVLLFTLILPAFAQIPPVQGEPQELFKMRIIDVEPGTGAAAAAGQRYKVHYTGWLHDGTKFDSSRDRAEPLTFIQGRRQVIAGWETGFAGMKVGGKRRLLIPYQLAYGDKGSGKVIPPKADLIFDVELLGVEDMPVTPAAQEILDGLSSLEKKFLSMAESLPADKFSWRPGEGVRSFGEVFRHIGNDNRMWLAVVSKTPEPEEVRKMDAEANAPQTRIYTREETLADLRESFDAVRKAIEPLRAGNLGADVKMFGMNTTRRGLFILFLNHASEHLGQLIAYERVNGIVPPWSK
ncbi:MAG TPA: DinB family protein [Bryobacteraceae bacterium]|jgi:uncharacterized damage-inducible protein DinB